MPTKTFRDPIHGDITVAQMQLAIIDTDVFQRLRYIRQNGLLHFIFPGAVHTRFAHSIGTMHIAQRVFSRLFPHYRPATEETTKDGHLEVRYIGTVFELAALLHDVGHCAFSHSIEKVETAQGAQLFPSLESLSENWNKPNNGLWQWWHSKEDAINKHLQKSGENWVSKPQHEEIGLLLAYLSFNNPSILEPTSSISQLRLAFGKVFPKVGNFSPKFEDLVNDVLALMRDQPDWLPPSDFMIDCLLSLVAETKSPPPTIQTKHAFDLFKALHSLVSGTLDVDRMDYLLRDSKFAGTVIGKYDLDLIVNSLSLRHSSESDKLHLCISDRARGAVDDFLWSRWQLYLQVVNHKANVMLNALFINAFQVAVPNPQLMHFENLLQFTDDWVMTKVRKTFLDSRRGESPVLQPAKLAFLRNRLPKHLLVLELNSPKNADEENLIYKKREEIAYELGIEVNEIEFSITESDLIKLDAALPRVVRKGLAPGGKIQIQVLECDFIADSWKDQNRPTRVRRVHFFTQRHAFSVANSNNMATTTATESNKPQLSVRSKRTNKPKI